MGTTEMLKKLAATMPLGVLLSLLLLTGCTVGPDYKQPDVATVPKFRSQLSPSDANSFADLAWWQVFNDKALQLLITEALANNYDLQVAVARIDQARALVGVAKSEFYPQLGYQGVAQGEKALSPANMASTVTYGTYAGVLNAAWEADVWGRIERSTEAARANLFAQQYIRRGVMLTLVSGVAASYFQLLELDREAAIAQESADAYKRTLDLFTLRFQAGKDSRLSVERAQAAYSSSMATIANLRREITQQENAISILVGAYPRGIERGRSLTEQSFPGTPVGLTSDLLRRRPDILEAEQNMIGANAEIGVAVADFYPTIGLSAFVGGQGIDIGNVLHPGFSIWNVAGDLAGPIFTGGRLEATYHERQAFWDETVAQYKQTILVAFRETSDALIAQQTLVHQRAGLEDQVKALRQSVDLALLRYDAGRATYFEVLEAEQQLFPGEDELALTQRDQLLAVVDLYKALGGGWKLTDDEWSRPQ